MIPLFSIKQPVIDFSKHNHLLHGEIVEQFTEEFRQAIGAPYSIPFNSCTNAIELLLRYLGPKWATIPSMIPPVVLNAVIHSGSHYVLTDAPKWVGGTYTMLDETVLVVDSAQRFEYGQWDSTERLGGVDRFMLHSFYPTKPVAGIDGGMISTNSEKAAVWLRKAVMNGSVGGKNSWGRKFEFPGWKAYMSTAQASVAWGSLREWPARKERLDKIRDTYNFKFGLHNTSDHLYRVPAKNKESFMLAMENAGISTGIHYEPTHCMPPYAMRNESVRKIYQDTDYAFKRMVSIPFNDMLSDSDIKHIVEKVQPMLEHDNV